MLFDAKRVERLAQQPFVNHTLPGLRYTLQVFTDALFLPTLSTSTTATTSAAKNVVLPVCKAIETDTSIQLMAVQAVYWNHLWKLEQQQRSQLSALSISIIEAEITRIQSLLAITPNCSSTTTAINVATTATSRVIMHDTIDSNGVLTSSAAATTKETETAVVVDEVISALWTPYLSYLRSCVTNRQAASTMTILPAGPPI